jgi:hypothetical protein
LAIPCASRQRLLADPRTGRRYDAEFPDEATLDAIVFEIEAAYRRIAIGCHELIN